MGRTKIAVQEISVFLVLPTIAGAVEIDPGWSGIF